jgi:mannose-6-phosphate isomerase class I
VVDGSLTLHGPDGTLELRQGKAAFLGAAEDAVTATGIGVAFVSASGRR